MSPQHVQRDFLRPPDLVHIRGVKRSQAVWSNLSERAEAGVGRAAKPVQTGQTVKADVGIQLQHNVRGLERVDDDDRLSPTVKACLKESVNIVGMPYLIRVVTRRWLQAGNLTAEETIVRTSGSGSSWDC